MTPILEELESRCLSSATSQSVLSAEQVITEVVPPANVNYANESFYLDFMFALGALTSGRYGLVYQGPKQIVRLDTPDTGLVTTYRLLAPVLGGTIPVIIAPVNVIPQGDQFFGGMWFERASIAQKWYDRDWPGENGSYPILDMPVNPANELEIVPIDPVDAIIAAAQDNPLWWLV